ncbi:MAG TPA: helix-hairpin-helix domain-containing protein [Methanocorpusculum sp.]|nr:helix-hairpin-helix domain-containing protein [Methanocorpusculum sp.]
MILPTSYSSTHIFRKVAESLFLPERAVTAVTLLFSSGATIPFIARYHKDIGQYQHDVDQKRLATKLAEVTEQTVNTVGVDLNTASPSLLPNISDIGPTLSEKIVAYRLTNGPFTNRKELLNVSYVDHKIFEHAAGFLRICKGNNLLDKTGIRPERYSTVGKMADYLSISIERLVGNRELVKKIKPEIYVGGNCGLEIITDIIDELKNPGRDIRCEGKKDITFDPTVQKIVELKDRKVLPGIVTNGTAFGAFEDVGVHQDGLGHISELTNRFITHPSKVILVGDHVRVMIMGVETAHNRINLNIKRVV